MRVIATTEAPARTGADTVVVGLVAGEGVAHDVEGGVLGGLVESGEARPAFRRLAVAHAAGLRWILVGLGERSGLDPERARVAAALAHARARELGARHLCWEVPHKVGEAVVAGLVEGTLLHAYAYDRFRARDEDAEPTGPDTLTVSAHHDVGPVAARAALIVEAQNRARDLQNAPPNELTPSALAEHARGLAQIPGVTVEVAGRGDIEDMGMGAFAAVARGSEEEPRLIVARHEPDGAQGPLLGYVGKAVTFDSGGLALKPASSMHEMKFDMSGGAAVLEALGAIARLALPVRVLAVVGATENLPSGRAVRPGDIVRALNGTTIEVNNPDAEGRLVLADCLAHAIGAGAERLIDLATLTGAIVTALGSTHAGLMASDDGWAEQVLEAARASGEAVWRLPLHPEYAEMIKGRYADIVNVTPQRKASSITAGEFLRRFVGEVPWAHLDIAGVASDRGRAYAAKGGSGFGVRLLVELAAAQSASSTSRT